MRILNKLVIFLTLVLFFPNIANAVLYVSFARVHVIKHTIGGNNDTFQFNYYRRPNPAPLDEFEITTESGNGSMNFGIIFVPGPDSILESYNPNWDFVSVVCNSTNPLNKFQYRGTGVDLELQDGSDSTCTFTSKTKNLKNPVLIAPGVLGTEIFKELEKMWPDSIRMLTDFGDNFMDPLEFKTDLTPSSTLLSTHSIVKREATFDYSESLINEFTSQGYTEGTSSDATLFTFPYDWRFGVNRGNSVALKLKIDAILAQTGASKVDVVAHSTGGLLVKRYVSEYPDSHNIAKAVFVGVPNTGAPKAVKVLLEGDDFGVTGLSESEMKKISQNMPVVYDLLPSAKYFEKKGSFVHFYDASKYAGQVTTNKDLNYTETLNYYQQEHNLNSLAINNAQDLHTESFDEFDLRTKGIELYNIAGCKNMDTIGKISENHYLGSLPTYNTQPTPGDGTVPLESATNLPVDSEKKFYALKTDHGKMLSQEGIRQKIVNIISGSSLEVKDKLITQDITKCKLKGKGYSVYSPVDFEVTDQDGNRLGIAPDSSLQNDIPNAGFQVFGERKFVYLPDDEGQTYTVNIKGTGNGTFTFKNQIIEDDQVIQTQVFSNIPVNTQLTGSVSENNSITVLNLDTNGDGVVDQTIKPSSILNAEQSQDLAPPVSTSTLTGLMGQSGFYRGNVSVALFATDPVIAGEENQTSGILKTSYKLDNSDYQAYQNSFDVTTEGSHTLSFFSTDKAGNNEPEQTINFVIDKTSPELSIQFAPTLKDIKITANDNISTSSTVTILDQDDTVTLTDQAGNTSQIKLKEKDRKHKLKAEIKSLSYNGQAQDIRNTSLSFNWEYSKDKLKELNQRIKSKKDFNIEAEYQNKNNTTKLEGKDQTGKIHKTLPGLILLKVKTEKGDFRWAY